MKVEIACLLLLSILASQSTCGACTGSLLTNPNGCAACHDGSMSNQCSKCQTGYGTPTNFGCVICEVGEWGPFENMNMCNKCPSGKITAGTGKSAETDCFLPMLNCATHISGTQCSVCTGDLVPTSDKSQCVAKIPSCTAQTSATVCTACETGKAVINQATCVAQITNCKIQTSETLCAECASGHLLSSDFKACQVKSSSAGLIALGILALQVLLTL